MFVDFKIGPSNTIGGLIFIVEHNEIKAIKSDFKKNIYLDFFFSFYMSMCAPNHQLSNSAGVRILDVFIDLK